MQQVFAVAAGRLPDAKRHPFLRRHWERLLGETPGLIDWTECEEDVMILFFGTVTHAEKAIANFKKCHAPVDDQIMLAEQHFDTRTFRIKGPLEGQEGK